MHEGSCHCGAVRLTLPSTPVVATDCNCSLCRRIGGPWVYYEFGAVKIQGRPEATAEYVQRDGNDADHSLLHLRLRNALGAVGSN